MRILITGSQGFVGTSLVAKLSDHEVFGIDKHHGRNEHSFSTDFVSKGNYFRCDVSEHRQLERVIDRVRPDLVYHAAAEFGRWNGEDFYETMWTTNVIGTKNVLTLKDKYKFKLVHFSTSEIYGDYNGVMTESIADEISLRPLNDYSISKWTNELQISNSPKDCCIVRLFNVYGHGEHYSPYRSAICRMIYSNMFNMRFKVFVNHIRSHLYVDDAIHALSNLINVEFCGQAYNLGSSVEYSMGDIAYMINGTSPPNFQHHTDPDPSAVSRKQCNSDKAIEDLGLNVSTDLEIGIANTKKWMSDIYQSS